MGTQAFQKQKKNMYVDVMFRHVTLGDGDLKNESVNIPSTLNCLQIY